MIIKLSELILLPKLEISTIDEAAELAYDALEHYEQIIDKFGSFDDAMDAEKVVRCAKCAFYDADKLLCRRYGLTDDILMFDFGYCSCGIEREVFDKLMESCRANGGWCTPGVIVTSDELKNILAETDKEVD